MTSLIRYEAARAALVEAKSFDEVKEIHDKAEAMRAYARMAGDVELEQTACEIRFRAKRRFGELYAELHAEGRVHTGGRPPKTEKTGTPAEPVSKITLGDLGVSKKFSSESQQAASISERAFEAMVARVRQQIADGHRVSLSTEEKQERRATREKVLGGIQCALPKRKYGVILADPEWRFEPWSRQSGMNRAADNHYPTSCTEIIAARDVPSIAADDCVLFLCATAPMLPHALLVMAVWEFNYVSNYVLAKDRAITGYWTRNKHEHLLIGTRGRLPCPAPGTQWESLIPSPVGEHSAKAGAVAEMIEFYFPSLPKIELNRRGPARPGWDAWGNEAEAAA
jgi:N6-adenosine-specific RNA methylase IME4